MAKIGVGVVGVGAMGRHHARVLAELPGSRLVGVHDVRTERGERVADEYGCATFTELEELLEVAEAVVVAVPTPQHHEVGVRCLEAGVDVLVEKPIACTLEGADRLIEAAEVAGRILQVGHIERYNPAVQAALPVVTRPGFIEVDRLGIFVRRSLETDVLLDLMIHDIDVVQALIEDEVVDVRAVGVPVLSEEIDIANARLEFQNGCIVNLTASRVSANRVRKVRIFQPAAYLSVDYTEQTVEHYRLERSEDRDGPRAETAAAIRSRSLEVERAEPLVLELQDFVDCVARRRRPVVGGDAARRALQVALRVRQAVEEQAATLREMVDVEDP